MRIHPEKAAQMLLEGEVVALPTETVYGLAAGLHQFQAVKKIFEIKGRPSNNPLIIHVADPLQVVLFAQQQLNEDFWKLAEAFWPGPLTLVVPIIPGTIAETVRAGLSTAAFRMPAHEVTRQILRMTGPLVMPSANLSGRPSATSAEHVEADFGKDFPVCDGGACQRGLESTILYEDEGRWKVVRQGALGVDAFEPVLGYVPAIEKLHKNLQPLCPGQMFRHYAPRAKLSLALDFPEGMKGVIVGFADRHYPRQCKVYVLGSVAHPEEVAHRLYEVLRRLDEDGVEHAWVDMNFPKEGLLATVDERLRKAAKGN